MPKYTYVCPLCQWTGDRIVKLDERDKQLCKAIDDDDGDCCYTQLQREEISLTSHTPYSWQP